MRLRNIPESTEAIEKSEYVIKNSEVVWINAFDNTNPVHIEVGTGKGQFLMELSMQNPNINYVGIEKYTSVLYRAIQKLENEEIRKNLRFLCIDAKELEEYFAEQKVERIYLNFSDPWPKERHAKRRLPSKEFLQRYDKILLENGTIEFKTDNRGLFDFAVEEVAETKWHIDQITYDLHHDEKMNQGNVMTEYEEKFSSKGNPICKYIISR